MGKFSSLVERNKQREKIKMKNVAVKTGLSIVAGGETLDTLYQDMDYVVNYDKYAKIYNTPERMNKFLAVHTAWSEYRMREEKVLILSQDDIFFDHEEMGVQPRPDGTKEEFVVRYTAIARKKGIKKAISVEFSGLRGEGEKKFAGRRGHHRHEANGIAENEFIPAYIVDLSNLKEDELIDYLNEDNAHYDNGNPNKTQGIKSNLSDTLRRKTFCPEQKKQLHLLHAQRGAPGIPEDQKKRLEDRIKFLEKEVKDALASRAHRWGIADLSTAKRHATHAWNKFQQEQILKVRIPSAATRTSNYQIASAAHLTDPTVIAVQWLYSCGGGTAYLYKVMGKILDDIDQRVKRQGIDVSELSVKVYVTLKSVKGFDDFYKNRRFVQEELSRQLCFETLVGKGIECLYAGQMKAEGLWEDGKRFYSLAESEEKHKKYLAITAERKQK
jgi:hypothetical protein